MTTLLRNVDAPRFGQDGTSVTGYASPSRGSATVSAWRIMLDPGAGSPLHELTHDEVFIALRGQATVSLATGELTLSAGDGLSVPPSTPFQIRNDSAEPFEAIACMAAGGQARIGSGAPFTPPWAI